MSWLLVVAPTAGIELLLNSRVLGVTATCVRVADKEGRETEIPSRACVWSTGIGMHPLVSQLKAAFPGVQTHNRCVWFVPHTTMDHRVSDWPAWTFRLACMWADNSPLATSTANLSEQTLAFTSVQQTV